MAETYNWQRFERPRRSVPPCGTTPAFRRHRTRGEEPCSDCRQVWNHYSVRWQQRRRLRRRTVLL